MTLPQNAFLSIDYFREPPSSLVRNEQIDAAIDWWMPARAAQLSSEKGGSLKNFVTHLRNADILDVGTIPFQGASIWLPNGMKLRRVYDNFVSGRYEEAGLEPFAYPSLVPDEIFKPLDGLFNLKNQVFLVGTDDEMENGEHRAILSPTGEATIYTHWAKYIKTHSLPIKMYRDASYFRPSSQQAGMGTFNGGESTGVFEFHAAYEDRNPISKEIDVYQVMLDNVFSHFRVPVVWSLRPRWTNNAAISLHTFGADTLLPNHTSLQIGAIYDQDSIFSQRFNIAVTQNGQKQNTKQVAGYCSRRVLMSYLMISCAVYGKIVLHPDFSPIQAAVVFQQRGDSSQNAAEVNNILHKELFRRHAINLCASREQAARQVKSQISKGVPLVILIQDKRDADDDYKVIMFRADTGAEAHLRIKNLYPALAQNIKSALSAIGTDMDSSLQDYRRSKVEGCELKSQKEVAAAKSDLKIFPLGLNEHAVKLIDSSAKGEILGFVKDSAKRPCLVSRQEVVTRAIMSRRF